MGWGDGTEYYWVVLCKNRGIHNKYNLFSRHAIPLGETDEVCPLPQMGTFLVRCDDCRQENSYSMKDVLRAQLDSLTSFTPHPLFQDLQASAPPTKESVEAAVSAAAAAKPTVLDRVRAAVEPWFHFRRREDPPPRWRR